MTENRSRSAVHPTLHDVVVVGGGPAGLSAATALTRSLRSVVVVDAGAPHTAPSLPDVPAHEAPDHAAVVRDRAVTARRTASGFEVGLAGGGTLRGRRLLLTTGLTTGPDTGFPDVPGAREHGVTGDLPRPGGHAVPGRRTAVLATGRDSVRRALVLRRLGDRVTVFLHDLDDLDDETWERFAALGVEVVTGRVGRVLGADGAATAVVLDDGHAFAVDALVLTPVRRDRDDLFAQLGGHLEEDAGGSRVATDDRGATAVDGVWAVGDTTDPPATAAAAGVLVAGRLHADLVAGDESAARTHRAPTVREVFSAASEARVSAQVLGDRVHGLPPAAAGPRRGTGVTDPRRP